MQNHYQNPKVSITTTVTGSGDITTVVSIDYDLDPFMYIKKGDTAEEDVEILVVNGLSIVSQNEEGVAESHNVSAVDLLNKIYADAVQEAATLSQQLVTEASLIEPKERT